MRVGSIVYDTCQGLGYLAKSFYDAGVLTDPVVFERASLNHRRPPQRHWFLDAPRVTSGSRIRPVAMETLRHVDVALFFETPFDWDIIRECNSIGVRTVLMPMYECMPAQLPVEPDLFLCPSTLDLEYYPDHSVYLPIPVEDCFTWRKRERAEVFVHNAGHGGLLNRNGTGLILDALPLIESPIELRITSQGPLQWDVPNDPRLTVSIGNKDREHLYAEGDVFLWPDAFDGLSLPVQEAFASGMVVMATDRKPANEYLPTAPLIPVSGYRKNRISGRCLEFDEALIDPADIARTVDGIYGAEIGALSEQGREFKERLSWDNLKPRYLEVLSGE